MTTTVGRLRPCGVLDWKFTVLSHNTIRGAAGAALLNAELLKVQGYLGDAQTQASSRSLLRVAPRQPLRVPPASTVRRRGMPLRARSTVLCQRNPLQ